MNNLISMSHEMTIGTRKVDTQAACRNHNLRTS